MSRFEGKVVLVTGGSSGIGAAIAERFHSEGARVFTAQRTIAQSPGLESIEADLGDPGAPADVIARVSQTAGQLDVLVNNAGLERLTPIDEMDEEALALFRRILDINIAGTAIVTACALPQMPDGSRIINTASVWGRVAEPLFGAYVASKHAVIGLTKTWARELGPRGVRVNAVCPGWVETEAALRSADELAARDGSSAADILAGIAAAQCLPGPVMQTRDVTGPYLFLASDLAANVTGQTLGVDRGEQPW